jgi:Zn-finger nucleic acid-binding protein
MQEETHKGVTLDYCSGCSVVWFDHNELSKHLESRVRDKEVVPSDLVFHPCASDAVLGCPRCSQKPLAIGSYLGFSFHKCPQCSGVLIDMGTIAAVARKISKSSPQESELSLTSPENFLMGGSPTGIFEILGDLFGGMLDI